MLSVLSPPSAVPRGRSSHPCRLVCARTTAGTLTHIPTHRHLDSLTLDRSLAQPCARARSHTAGLAERMQRIVPYTLAGLGDIVGCGITAAGGLYFTLNGMRLEEAYQVRQAAIARYSACLKEYSAYLRGGLLRWATHAGARIECPGYSPPVALLPAIGVEGIPVVLHWIMRRLETHRIVPLSATQRVPLMLLPTIGLEGAGAIVSVNFGCCPFRYQPPDERPSLLPNKAMHRRERSEG